MKLDKQRKNKADKIKLFVLDKKEKGDTFATPKFKILLAIRSSRHLNVADLEPIFSLMCVVIKLLFCFQKAFSDGRVLNRTQNFSVGFCDLEFQHIPPPSPPIFFLNAQNFCVSACHVT